MADRANPQTRLRCRKKAIARTYKPSANLNQNISYSNKLANYLGGMASSSSNGAEFQAGKPYLQSFGPMKQPLHVLPAMDLQAERIPDTCHLRGVDDMTTLDVREYFSPISVVRRVEWLNPSCCNVRFRSSSDCRNALNELSTLIPTGDKETGVLGALSIEIDKKFRSRDIAYIPWRKGRPNRKGQEILVRLACVLDRPTTAISPPLTPRSSGIRKDKGHAFSQTNGSSSHEVGCWKPTGRRDNSRSERGSTRYIYGYEYRLKAKRGRTRDQIEQELEKKSMDEEIEDGEIIEEDTAETAKSTKAQKDGQSGKRSLEKNTPIPKLSTLKVARREIDKMEDLEDGEILDDDKVKNIVRTRSSTQTKNSISSREDMNTVKRIVPTGGSRNAERAQVSMRQIKIPISDCKNPNPTSSSRQCKLSKGEKRQRPRNENCSEKGSLSDGEDRPQTILSSQSLTPAINTAPKRRKRSRTERLKALRSNVHEENQTETRGQNLRCEFRSLLRTHLQRQETREEEKGSDGKNRRKERDLEKPGKDQRGSRGSFDELSRKIWKWWHLESIGDESIKRRRKEIFQIILQTGRSVWPNFKARVFGSCAFGLADRYSDVDILVCASSQKENRNSSSDQIQLRNSGRLENVHVVERKSKVKNRRINARSVLNRIMKLLKTKHKGRFKISPVLKAKHPFLRLVEKVSSLSFDIFVSSQFKSNPSCLLADALRTTINFSCPCVRVVVRYLRAWAYRQMLLQSRAIGSYTFTLVVLSYLQSVRPNPIVLPIRRPLSFLNFRMLCGNDSKNSESSTPHTPVYHKSSSSWSFADGAILTSVALEAANRYNNSSIPKNHLSTNRTIDLLQEEGPDSNGWWEGICNTIDRTDNQELRCSKQHANIGKLVVEFFEAHRPGGHFNPSQSALIPARGCISERRSEGDPRGGVGRRSECLVIEDPIRKGVNVSRKVGSGVLDTFRLLCAQASNILDTKRDPFLLIDELGRRL
mmetsp:Transcript_12046/g.17949  ORF Transcript_12046/g.17949 Transcript_12046/m.17949 type:complete len:987 (-) Transcript_12046:95-3055(-)|eukprot:CAMPEP_0167764096 /NCGR_PEP_ID=MMETSP0110_2-20121227/13806_1 /TAXON_ID=629695 /ORGANISM="Gymnochlora sp., Strain CCMP2014" /LENGTH=986 /DNA_ID=CAMNT_0007651389 /DNA_START=1344 /DNA_END=4304 /DNA_ORIENTATION=-